MEGWARMSESKDFPYVKFIALSYAKIFDSPHADPRVDYLFDENRIYVKSRNVNIINLCKSGDEPVRFRFDGKEGELNFNRYLTENELLLLFNGDNIKIIDEKSLPKHQIVPNKGDK